ncbi:DUF6261 family protein [Labilibaculum sp. K2S]|uniref:DUF6261 family protein n=1 Tax=Labilibaculum sp. K2S TaxID=3056386 RepID=UPI0025A34208|nr:DUF6261 family protein [Labilibaculum sp. K2S]MDM8159216.1 DUF6261 family protein [Labilibaculum sp. K2S]
MGKINANCTIKETAEAGRKISDLNTNYPIAEDTYCAVSFEKLSAKTQGLIHMINAGWLESDLKEKDEVRDLDIRAIFYEVTAKCMRRTSREQQKAVRVKAILDRYGMKITDSTYTSESAEIRAMLSDIKAPELAEDRKAIPELDGLISNLEGSQASFDQSDDQLRDDKMGREKTKPASTLAKELRNMINNDLCGYLSAMTQANPEKYAAFSNKFFQIIEDANKEVNNRLAALKRKKEAAKAESN